MSEAVGEGFVDGMITVLNKRGGDIGDTVRRQMDPILRDVIREQSPAVLELFRQGAVDTLKLSVRADLQPDVVRNAQNASLGASRGSHQAMVESGIIRPDGSLNARVKMYVWLALAAVGLMAVSMFSLLVLLNLLVLHHWRHRRRPGDAKPA